MRRDFIVRARTPFPPSFRAAALLYSVVRRPRVRLENELLVLSTMENGPRQTPEGRDIEEPFKPEFCIIRLWI